MVDYSAKEKIEGRRYLFDFSDEERAKMGLCSRAVFKRLCFTNMNLSDPPGFGQVQRRALTSESFRETGRKICGTLKTHPEYD